MKILAQKPPEQGMEGFGQHDHVRIYGMDLIERLKKADFRVKLEKYINKFSDDQTVKYGLKENGEICICL